MLHDELRTLRRELHQIPEVGLSLPKTQQLVLDSLDGLPLEISTGAELSSVTAVLRGGRARPAVLLHGDMDALAVTERSGEPFSSRHDGAMHACGHDLHTAGLVGAARLLAGRRAELAGDVVFMFQPGEEGYDGAGHMIAEGVLEAAGDRVVAAYGLHVFSSMSPTGTVKGRPGPLMAASGALFVRVVGAGGHGSTPHQALDPVSAACEMVTTLQAMVTRRFDVFDPVVVTVGTFHAGTRRNVIPEDAERAAELAARLCADIATAHGMRADVRYEPEYPLTANDATDYAFAERTAREIVGDQRYERLRDPPTGSEDFSRVLEHVPGAFLFLGASREQDPAAAAPNHSPLAAFDDSVLADGATLLAELAARRLAKHADA